MFCFPVECTLHRSSVLTCFLVAVIKTLRATLGRKRFIWLAGYELYTFLGEINILISQSYAVMIVRVAQNTYA